MGWWRWIRGRMRMRGRGVVGGKRIEVGWWRPSTPTYISLITTGWRWGWRGWISPIPRCPSRVWTIVTHAFHSYLWNWVNGFFYQLTILKPYLPPAVFISWSAWSGME
jgi:hypothetical protein